MESAFADWAEFEGAIYMGGGTAWEYIWLLLSIVLCVVALVVGSRHEHDAYKRLKK